MSSVQAPPATDVARAIARRVSVVITIVILGSAILISHVMFSEVQNRITMAHFGAIESRLINAVASGDLHELTQLIASVNAVKDYSNILLTSGGSVLASISSVRDPYQTEKSITPHFAQSREFHFNAKGRDISIRFVSLFPFANYLRVLLSALLIAMVVAFGLQKLLLNVAGRIVLPIVDLNSSLDDILNQANGANISEVQLSHGFREINQAVGKFQQVTSQLKTSEKEKFEMQKEASLVALARQVAHDIRSPASLLTMIVQTQHVDPAEQKELIAAATKRLIDIANDLLQTSRNRLTPDKKMRADIAKIVSSVIKEKQILFASKNVDISFSGSTQSCQAKINATEFSRIVSNILNNSIESIPHDNAGVVSLRIDDEGEAVSMTVDDNGRGISEENLALIRANNGASFDKELGNGLGLKHVIETVNQSLGSFEISSTVGVGTSIRITLRKA